MMRMLLGSARRSRQLHTFISKETIKPSSPTPSHLKTYNLSLLDQVNPSVLIPVVFFCPNHHHQATQQLKKSLSQTLTQFYPFSGRLVDGARVDCNDEGVDFIEVKTDGSFSKLVHIPDSDYQPLDHLFPTDHMASAWDPPSKGWGSLVKVQLTYFSCGGITLAISMSHKIGDGSTLFTFMNHWASVNRVNSFDDKVQTRPPHFVSSPKTKFSPLHEIVLDKGKNCVTKKFVFPNSKLALLKSKVKEDDTIMINPTRIEVLSSLLYGCAVSASMANSRNHVKGYMLMQIMNMRNRMVQPLPETYVRNMSLGIIVLTMNESELALNSLTSKIKNAKMQLTSVTDSQMSQRITQSAEFHKNRKSKMYNDNELYGCTSLCRFPAYEVNFGWGKPIRVTLSGCPMKNLFLLMDTPNGDGIEALVALEEEDMSVFQNDEQLLEFAL